VKDLSVFSGEADLTKVLFVDNHIFSFAANLKNGIPVVDFLGDRQDTELLKVANYVLALADESNLMRANE
jgi:TFIIF-interacting CTD phosphatase-like protein